MDRFERRELLRCCANPDMGRDYISVFTGQVTGSFDDNIASVRIRYVPDRLIFEVDVLSAYLAEMSSEQWATLEELAKNLLSDIQNQAVPRWVEISAEIQWPTSSQITRQSTLVEDQQPGWSNDNLFLRRDI